MPIVANSPLSSSVANDTFLDKTIDDETIGVLGLNNTTNPNSGDQITNTQRYINELGDASGVAGEGDADRKVYSSNNYIVDGDDRKVAIGKLDAQAAVNAQNIDYNTIQTYAAETITASGTITKDDDYYKQVRRVVGDGGAVSANTVPFGDSSGTEDGVVIILRGTDNTNTVEFTQNDAQYGMIINGPALLQNYYELEVMYDSVAERWIEQRRNF